MTDVSCVRFTCGDLIAGPGNPISIPRNASRRLKSAWSAKTFFYRFPIVPELPEVETVVRSIAPLKGRKIITAEFRNLRVLRGGDPDDMAERLQGRLIAAIQRYGKYILISLEDGSYL